MKPSLYIFISLIAVACESHNGPERVFKVKRDHTYVDPESGRTLLLEYDSSGNIVEQKTHRHINYFVDENNLDTIDSKGTVVNGQLNRK